MPSARSQILIRHHLESQSVRIERALHFHKIEARVTGGTLSPRWVSFDLQLPLGQRVNRVLGLADEIALALGVANVRINRQGGNIRLQIPREVPQPLRLMSILEQYNARDIPPATAVLGLAENGRPLLLRLPSPDVAHVLVAGTTGSGKTALLRTMALSLACQNPQRRLQMVLIDPKLRGLQPLSELAHLMVDIISDFNDAVDWLGYLVDLMEQRDLNGEAEPSVVVIIDELAELLQAGGKTINGVLTRLAQRGREAGIHLICGTQKPSAKVIGSLLKANFPVRLVGRVASPDDARVAAGVGGSGAEKLGGAGDFVAVAGGTMTRFQAAYISEREIAVMIDDLWSSHEQASRSHPSASWIQPQGQDQWIRMRHEEVV